MRRLQGTLNTSESSGDSGSCEGGAALHEGVAHLGQGGLAAKAAARARKSEGGATTLAAAARGGRCASIFYQRFY